MNTIANVDVWGSIGQACGMEQSRATLDIISDPICPWCYIGKVKLDRALAQRPDHGLDIFWRPFQLNPDMPAEGMDRMTYLETKFGGPERAKEIYGRIEDAASAAGLTVDFAKIKRTPNTFDAHRLIRWARTHELQQPVMDSLFTRYFERGEDIGDRNVLLDVGTEAGLDTKWLTRLYDEDADRDVVTKEEASARQMGISGVPTFILGEKYALSGAQETETWLDALDRLSQNAGET